MNSAEAQLADAGYVVLRGVVPAELLRAWQAATEAPPQALRLTEVLRCVAAYLPGDAAALLQGWRDPQPGRGQQGLHQDAVPRGPADPPSVLTCLIFLDDFAPDNGATGLIPGSHRWPRPLPKSQQQPDAEHPEEIQLRGHAGDALLFDGHLWHRGRTNRSGAPRRAIQCRYSTPGATVPLG